MFGYTIISKREYRGLLDRIASVEYRLYLANGDLDFKNKQIRAMKKEINERLSNYKDPSADKNLSGK